MLTPLTEHTLLIFWVQLLVLLAAARLLGALAVRFGQPAVVGELGAGLLIGPSVFGRIAPDAAAWLFPGGELQSGVLLSVAWLGAFLLLLVTGFETDLSLLSNLGRSSAFVSIGSLVVPLGCGFLVGFAMPVLFIGDEGNRLPFALFIGVALSISALPVVARILTDMNLMRRNIGQVILAAAMANDLVGWILLGAIAGLAQSGEFSLRRVSFTLLAIFAFIGLALTLGQRLVDAGLRMSRRGSPTGSLSVVIIIALVAGTITQSIGVEAVLGAFIIGIVLGRSRYLGPHVRSAVERMTAAVFAPIFFATSGLYVDVGAVSDPETLLWAGIILGVAAGTKLVGSALGGWLGRMTFSETMAVGFGLNARGAMEIVLATVALGLGVFNQRSYTAIVLMAMATSMMAPPLLRRALRNWEPAAGEAERLEREELLSESVIARAKTVLLPSTGGRNSIAAAILLERWLREDATVTAMTAVREGEQVDSSKGLLRVLSVLRDRDVDQRITSAHDASEAILAEANLGYDLIALGVNEDFSGSHQLSPTIQNVLREATIPIMLVRRSTEDSDGAIPRIRLRRIIVPSTGTLSGQAAEEIAYAIAARTGARVDALHVVSRADKLPEPTTVGPSHHLPSVRSVLVRSLELARRFGSSPAGVVRTGSFAHEEILDAAAERQANLIVLGTQVRSPEGSPFLGHGVEFLLEHAPQTVAVIAFPSEGPDTEGH